MRSSETSIPGVLVLHLPAFPDHRGLFVKTFHETPLLQAGIAFRLRESYFSISKKEVIRGMHFQLPPHQHAKVVFCPAGKILDVVVDLRKDSAAYRQHLTRELSADNHLALYIPEGCAHGFKALTEGAMTYYLVSSEYNQQADAGIRYDSFGLDWNVEAPVLSERDKGFVPLQDFDSPF